MAIGPVSLPGLGDANPLRQNTAIRQLSERLEDYAPLADPVFTGDPQAPTPSLSDNDTSVATTAFVKGQDYTTKTYVDAADAILTTAVAGKAATVHTHAESDVTGLVADLAAKEPTIAAGTTSQYWRGDKTWQAFPTQRLVAAYVDRLTTQTTSTASIPNSTATPLVTGGVQIFSRSVTTTTATQVVEVWAHSNVTTAASSQSIVLAFFAGSTCIGAQSISMPTVGDFRIIFASGYYAPGAAGTYTISCRIGGQSGANFYINGATSLGGQMASAMFTKVIEP